MLSSYSTMHTLHQYLTMVDEYNCGVKQAQLILIELPNYKHEQLQSC